MRRHGRSRRAGRRKWAVDRNHASRSAGRARKSTRQWRDFSRFPSFMENVEASRSSTRRPLALDDQGAGRSDGRAGDRDHRRRAGRADRLGSMRSRRSRPPASCCSDAPPGRGTYVSLVQTYNPPAGARQARRQGAAARADDAGPPRPAPVQAAAGNRRGDDQCVPVRPQERKPAESHI